MPILGFRRCGGEMDNSGEGVNVMKSNELKNIMVKTTNGGGCS
jgi:hypothetical protein